jgi:hypothetical protein
MWLYLVWWLKFQAIWLHLMSQHAVALLLVLEVPVVLDRSVVEICFASSSQVV